MLGHLAGPQAEHSPQSLKWHTTSWGFTPWRGKGAAEGRSSSLQEDTGSKDPGELGVRAGVLDNGWVGWWQQELRQAGPSLGAGPGWGHRKSQ